MLPTFHISRLMEVSYGKMILEMKRIYLDVLFKPAF